MRNTITIALLFALSMLGAQDATFSVELSNDSILLGNPIAVTFTLSGARGEDFFVGEFSDCDLLSGPNVSTQTTVMNGVMEQTTRYTYLLEPREAGRFYLPPAGIKVGDKYLETLPLAIDVYPNPDGIVQPIEPSGNKQAFGLDFFGSEGLNRDDFFRSDIWGEDFFQQFFQLHPFGEMLPPPDSLQRDQAGQKKRKTTRI